MGAYREDLAYIHHVGFGHFARGAASGLIQILARAGVSGTVCDLGCGTGILARALTDAGYVVEGFDLSQAMLALAKKEAPEARFRRGSFLDVKLGRYEAVTAIGEVFNYVFDPRIKKSVLPKIFRRIHAALRPGGVLLFDLAGPERARGTERNLYEGDDWVLFVERARDLERGELTRTMTIFRKHARYFRRSDETHTLRLYTPGDVASMLRATGFRVRHLKSYGDQPLPRGLAGFLAVRD